MVIRSESPLNGWNQRRITNRTEINCKQPCTYWLTCNKETVTLRSVNKIMLLYLNAKYLHAIGPHDVMWCWQIRTVDWSTVRNIEFFTAFLFKWFLFIFFVLVLSYNKTNSDWRVEVIIENFWPEVCKMLPEIEDWGQHFTNIPVKNFQQWHRRQSLFV